jgi:hypothetical protein
MWRIVLSARIAWKRPLRVLGQCVVGHHRFGRVEAELGKVGERPVEDGCSGVGVVAGVLLDVGVAGVVVDDAVQVVVADPAEAMLTVAGDSVAGPVEADEPLHIDMQKRRRP